MQIRDKFYIDGHWVAPAGAGSLGVTDASTGAPWATIPEGNEQDASVAVAAARRAFDGWSRTSPEERAAALEQIAAKNAFYQQLLDGAGNEALTNTLRLLNSRVMLLRSTSMQAPGRAKHSVAELSDLLRALEKRDGKAARVAGSLHVRNAASVAIGILQESLLTEAAD